MSQVFRYLNSGSLDAYSNMALDETLFLEYARTRAMPTLRLYGWMAPSLSIGCFQDQETVMAAAEVARHKVPVVRRITGGGMLFHGGEITYSLVCMQDDVALGRTVVESFKSVCAFVVHFYRSLGLNPYYAVEAPDYDRHHRQAYALCAASHEKYDILINGRKIGGNAQKRRAGVIFQHGSIPLYGAGPQAVSAGHAACVLKDVLASLPDETTLMRQLKQSFKTVFDADLVESGLTETEQDMFRGILTEKYAASAWEKCTKDVRTQFA